MPESISTPLTRCRLCGGNNLDLILDLGAQPPANSLRARREDTLPVVALAICRCRDCTTVQLNETVAPEHLFRDYVWVTGTSRTAREYSHIFYDHVARRCGHDQLFVVEVASNDGTFLQRFREHGHRVLGVDPAQNLARVAESSGIPTLPEFFGLNVARHVTQVHGHADVVIARNVLPHVPDPNDVVAGIAHCLKDDGVGAIEFHWVDKILSELHYDSIYHEHFFYHSLHSIGQLLARHALKLFDVTESPISGGSLVAYFSKMPRGLMRSMPSSHGRTNEDLLRSQPGGSLPRARWKHRLELKTMIESETKAGKRLIGYGASARSSTLLNFCGIDHRHLICIADQSPLKHDRYTPGTDVLIVSPERALAERPDTILLLAWNFKDEILKWLSDIGFHGDVIVPLPNRPQLLRI